MIFWLCRLLLYIICILPVFLRCKGGQLTCVKYFVLFASFEPSVYTFQRILAMFGISTLPDPR